MQKVPIQSHLNFFKYFEKYCKDKEELSFIHKNAALHAFFKLCDIVIEIEEKNFTVFEAKNEKLTDAFLLAHPKPETYKDVYVYAMICMERMYNDIIFVLLPLKNLKTVRLLLLLQSDLFKKMNTVASDEYPEVYKEFIKEVEMRFEIFFLLELIEYSSNIMFVGCSSKMQFGIDAKFEERLKALKVEDKFLSIPPVLQSFEEAKVTADLLLSKIDDYDNYINQHEQFSSRKFMIESWRGSLFNNLKKFQYKAHLKLELTEKSIFHLDKWLTDYATVAQLNEYEEEENNKMLELYKFNVSCQLLSYVELEQSKSMDLIKMEIDDSQDDEMLMEMNSIRLKYIKILKRYIELDKMAPINGENVKLYVLLGQQYLRIISKDGEEMESNMQKAEKYFQKSYLANEKFMKLGKKQIQIVQQWVLISENTIYM